MNQRLTISTRRKVFVVRVAQLMGATATVVAGVAVAVPTSGCQCAALCGNETSAILRNPANVTNKDPDAVFELCVEGACRSFQIVGTACVRVGGGGSICKMSSDGVDASVGIDAEDGDDVTLTIKSSAGAVIFDKEAELSAEDFEVCGNTCYEGNVAFTIPLVTT